MLSALSTPLTLPRLELDEDDNGDDVADDDDDEDTGDGGNDDKKICIRVGSERVKRVKKTEVG